MLSPFHVARRTATRAGRTMATSNEPVKLLRTFVHGQLSTQPYLCNEASWREIFVGLLAASGGGLQGFNSVSASLQRGDHTDGGTG